MSAAPPPMGSSARGVVVTTDRDLVAGHLHGGDDLAIGLVPGHESAGARRGVGLNAADADDVAKAMPRTVKPPAIAVAHSARRTEVRIMLLLTEVWVARRGRGSRAHRERRTALSRVSSQAGATDPPSATRGARGVDACTDRRADERRGQLVEACGQWEWRCPSRWRKGSAPRRSGSGERAPARAPGSAGCCPRHGVTAGDGAVLEVLDGTCSATPAEGQWMARAARCRWSFRGRRFDGPGGRVARGSRVCRIRSLQRSDAWTVSIGRCCGHAASTTGARRWSRRSLTVTDVVTGSVDGCEVASYDVRDPRGPGQRLVR